VIFQADGQTTGATVLSPVSGTIRWTQLACAGLSIEIDGAPGYYVALFHLDGYPPSGRHVNQGSHIGTVSDTACIGSGDHIHMVLYHQPQPTDNTPNTREAVPFSDPWDISGCNYPDDGETYQQHLGNLVPCPINISSPVASSPNAVKSRTIRR
jgi:murein DD-endopeptidase MepM/ murein hydrolase activator NlpD